MNKLKVLLVAILALCLMQIDVVKVPSRSSVYPDSMKYDEYTDTYLDFWAWRETWCLSSLNSGSAAIFRACLEPDRIPPKKKLIVSLRFVVIKNEEWQYLAACSVYKQKARRPGWEFDAAGNIRYTFDCDPLPFKPPGFEVVMHRKDQFVWDPHRIKLYSPHQHNGMARGFDLMTGLAGERPLNGTALEYLLAVPQLIPKEWDGRQVLFLGTVLKCEVGTYYAAVLSCNKGERSAVFHPLDYELYTSNVAAAIFV
jgi:hypothetical protein